MARSSSGAKAPPLAVRLATPLLTLTIDLGLSRRVSMFEYVRLATETSALEWARAETGGNDRGVF